MGGSSDMDWSTILPELNYRTSRSSGAGGQHVNKTETRVEVRFEPAASQGLTDREKRNLGLRLGNRLDGNGLLAVVDQSSRSQVTNRERATERLRELITEGIRPLPKPRKKKPFVASKKKRLAAKKRRSERKAERNWKY